jgi:hypothetical protein
MSEHRCSNCGHVDSTPPPEPPEGTWIKDRHGATAMHHKGGGWAPPGFYPFGQWEAMWNARGPLVECGPWGQDLEKKE